MTHALATVHTAHQLLWGHLYCEVSHVFVHTQYMCSCTGHCAVYSHVHAHCTCTCTHVGVHVLQVCVCVCHPLCVMCYAAQWLWVELGNTKYLYNT